MSSTTNPIVANPNGNVTATIDPLTGGSDILASTSTLKLPAGLTDLTSGVGSPVYNQIAAGLIAAKDNNPFDFPATTTQPLVTSITVNASAYANPKTYSYNTADGTPRVPIIGAPYGDTSLIITMANGYATGYVPIAESGTDYAGLDYGASLIGGQFMESTVTASSMQIDVRGSGLSSNFFPIIVNGILVAAETPAAINDGAIQIDFAARGTYKVLVGMQQSASLKGVTISEDDTVHPLADERFPVVVYGDSYVNGTVSPTSSSITGIALCGALSLIGGINAIPCGVSSTGYINDGGINLPLTNPKRLKLLAALTNASSSPLVLVFGGYNDVSISATAANVQAAAKTVIDYLLLNTAAKVIIYGAAPGKRNNSAATQTVDAGLSAAVAANNSGRVAFVPVSGAPTPWVSGTRQLNVTTGLVAGNSRYYTGNDGVHPSPFVTAVPITQANTTPSSGVEYLARRILGSAVRVAKNMRW